jgi:hypothetical protein
MLSKLCYPGDQDVAHTSEPRHNHLCWEVPNTWTKLARDLNQHITTIVKAQSTKRDLHDTRYSVPLSPSLQPESRQTLLLLPLLLQQTDIGAAVAAAATAAATAAAAAAAA